jgi:hypothetical protein
MSLTPLMGQNSLEKAALAGGSRTRAPKAPMHGPRQFPGQEKKPEMATELISVQAELLRGHQAPHLPVMRRKRASSKPAGLWIPLTRE